MNLNDSSILERWQVLVLDGDVEAAGIVAAVEERLQSAAVPGLRWSLETLSTGLVKALIGRRRDGPLVTYRPLPEYRIAVLAHPFGHCLHVAWLAVVTPHALRDVRRVLRLGAEEASRHEVGGELDAFDRLDLAALLSLTRHAVQSAVKTLAPSARTVASDVFGRDPSSLDD